MIFESFVGDEELMLYLPNNCKLQTIPREFLLSIANLYAAYKQIKTQRSTTGKKAYQANITNAFCHGLQNFTSINL